MTSNNIIFPINSFQGKYFSNTNESDTSFDIILLCAGPSPEESKRETTEVSMLIKSEITCFDFDLFQSLNKASLGNLCQELIGSHSEIIFRFLGHQSTKNRKIGKCSKEYIKTKDVIWVSSIPKRILSKSIRLEANVCLIFDEDSEFECDFLGIFAPLIIVFHRSSYETPNRKIKLTVFGLKTSEIFFSDKIAEFIDPSHLIVQVKNNTPNYENIFINPFSNQFKSDWHYIRLESILINQFWTEHASYNNRFLDLIIYYDPDFGKIYADKWDIVKKNSIIYGKFFVNECIRSKDNVRKKFVSLKHCDSVEEYFKKIKISASQQLIQNFERDIVTIPSIFEIFMYKFQSFFKYSTDFSKLRKLLLKRYFDYILKIKNKEYSEVFDFEVAIFNFDQFLFRIGSHISDPKVVHKINNYLKIDFDWSDLKTQAEIYNLFSPFLLVIGKSPEKNILFTNLLTGDISNYQEIKSGNDLLLNVGKFVVLKGFGLQGAKLALQEVTKVVSREGVKQVAKYGITETLKNGLITIVRGINIPVTIGLGIAEVAINVVALKIISGYYQGIIEF